MYNPGRNPNMEMIELHHKYRAGNAPIYFVLAQMMVAVGFASIFPSCPFYVEQLYPARD
jgi:hypothetical protein